MSSMADSEAVEILTLGLQGEVFAIEAGIVREILDLVPVTEVPNSGPFANGLINVRGKVVPLADLRVKFDMERTAPTIDTRIVVIEVPIDNDPTIVGILADKVHEVTHVTPSAVEATPKVGMRWRPDLIKGIGKRGDDFIIILDIERVFQSDEPASIAKAG